MTDPTGLFARIRMSRGAARRFYRDHGKALVHDHEVILALRKAEDTREAAIREFHRKYGPQPPFAAFQEWQQLWGDPEGGTEPRATAHSASDVMVLRYDDASHALFFMDVFAWGDMQALRESVTAQAFLQHVAAYRDAEGEDYIFFGGSDLSPEKWSS